MNVQVPAGALRALRALFQYLKGFGLLVWSENGAILRPITEPGHMQLTGNAMTQLHVIAGETGSTVGSLLQLVDCTLCPLGARLMQRWVSKPLVNMDAITERQDAVRIICSCFVASGISDRSPRKTCCFTIQLDV